MERRRQRMREKQRMSRRHRVTGGLASPRLKTRRTSIC